MKNFGNIANIKGWFNSVKQTVIINMGRSAIVPLNKFVKDYEEKVSFMRCEKLTNTIEILRNSTDDVQLTTCLKMPIFAIILKEIRLIRTWNNSFKMSIIRKA